MIQWVPLANKETNKPANQPTNQPEIISYLALLFSLGLGLMQEEFSLSFINYIVECFSVSLAPFVGEQLRLREMKWFNQLDAIKWEINFYLQFPHPPQYYREIVCPSLVILS